MTIEADRRDAAVARRNIERAGLASSIDLRQGAALDVLPTLSGPFDLVFIDADKPNNPACLRWALALSRFGTVPIGDNVVRGGALADDTSRDPSVIGVRDILAAMAAEPRLSATAIQTVGEKGWDGFVLAVVLEDRAGSASLVATSSNGHREARIGIGSPTPPHFSALLDRSIIVCRCEEVTAGRIRDAVGARPHRARPAEKLSATRHGPARGGSAD